MRKARQKMLYRARGVRYFLATTGLFAAWSFTFAPHSWQATPSLMLVASFIPLWIWGALLVAYAALLVADRGDMGRIAGYTLGAFISFVFAAAYAITIVTQPFDPPKNGWALVALIDLVVFHLASVKVTVDRRLGG